jgi:hypothetical protein
LAPIPFCVGALERQPKTRTRQIRVQQAVPWRDGPVEQHVLDARVIVEILNVDGV